MANQSIQRPRNRSRRPLSRLLVLAALAGILVLASGVRAADDVDLLRQRGGTPFVMVLLDTSASMNTTPPPSKRASDLGRWTVANADDPASKLFQVKRALYEVFSQVENVHFGFAGFNQDLLRVQSKHWVYRAEAPAAFFAAPLDVSYPSAAGEAWTFGTHFSLPAGTPGVAGSCSAPLDYSNDRTAIDRFSRLGGTGGQTTTLWIEKKGTLYRVTLARSANATIIDPTDPSDPPVPVANALGSDLLEVDVTVDLVLGCSPLQVELSQTHTVLFRKMTDFLMVESSVGVDGGEAAIGPETIDTGNCTADEYIAGVYDYQDMIAEGTCGTASSRPFTGRGWDSNNDVDVDPFCASGSCYNLRFPTTFHGLFSPTLDTGDFIPLDWSAEYREEFLKRLNPRHPSYLPQSQWDGIVSNGEASGEAFIPYFGIANFFEDTPDSDGILKLRNEDERPLVAYGNSPLGRAINDFRCWVLGDGNKCQDSTVGWNELFSDNDLWYHCRVPYLIVISDGEDNSVGENPTADASDFLQAAGVRTWAFTFQSTAQLQSMTNAGGGELITVANGDELKTELRRILGQIQQEARTFATAAVPSVQASTEQNIYITHFTPLNEKSVWEGHIRSFLSQPGLDLLNDTPNWDAADELLVQAPEPASDGNDAGVDLQLGNDPDERRVFYARERIPGSASRAAWGANRRLFDRTDAEPGPGTASADEIDLWNGLDLNFDTSSPASVRETRARANRIIEQTLFEKTWDDPDRGEVSYVLGEIFHSDPLIIGAPTNIRYFVQDAEETFDGGGAQQGTGYREFFAKHEFRRKLLIAGSNDGMVHLFDAGTPDLETFTDELGIERTDVRFDNGSGREVFAYLPRTVLPTITTMAENPFAHRWGVDGTLAVADAFVDPVHGGTPSASDRAWRTVAIGGLREGGSGYFALDITQPDVLRTADIGPLDSAGTQREVILATDREVVPDCMDVTGNGDLGCDDQVTYPSVLWEFTDSVWDAVSLEYVRLDEDGNAQPDLGETWSSADIGRIRVMENGALVKKYVAVFGGGLDPIKSGARGNWLYVVDIETGETIYKRRLQGSAPSAPAAVDTNQDSYLDTIYVGTTAGFMYRVDLEEQSGGGTIYPRLVTEMVQGVNGITYQTTRIEKGNDPSEPLWAPRAIFTTEGRPIYFPPAVLFVGDLGKFALGFGTGDREDLTSISVDIGRFYLFLDESDEIPESDLPMLETRFTEVTLAEADNPNLLSDPNIPVGQRGWYLVLSENERLIGPPFGFAGITFFATFTADDPRTDPLTCDISKSNCDNPNCRLTGDSRVYLVGTTDADAFLEVNGVLQRYKTIEGFITNPFTEQAVNLTSAGSDPPDPDADPDPTDEIIEDIVEKLKANFPERCKYGNHRFNVNVISSDRVSVEQIAAVPICIIESNWKEVSE